MQKMCFVLSIIKAIELTMFYWINNISDNFQVNVLLLTYTFVFQTNEKEKA